MGLHHRPAPPGLAPLGSVRCDRPATRDQRLREGEGATSRRQPREMRITKRMACGVRNRMWFRRAIYFHLGGLDVYPVLAIAAHTNS